MNPVNYVIGLVFLMIAVYLCISSLVRVYSRYGGTRLVTCPETERQTIVRVDGLHASRDIRLKDCTRWPTKGQCEQKCSVDLDMAARRKVS